MIKTNDIKKGMRVQLRGTGWYGTMADNMKGNTRVVDVEGIFHEMGSVYAHDIARALVNGKWEAVEYTPAQLKLRKMVG